MSDTGWQTVTGTGNLEVVPGGSFQPQYVFLRTDISAAPRARASGTVYPRRLQFAGMFGFQNQDIGPTGSNDLEVVLPHNLNYESEIYVIPTFVNGPATSQFVWWDLPAGVTLSWDMVYV